MANGSTPPTLNKAAILRILGIVVAVLVIAGGAAFLLMKRGGTGTETDNTNQNNSNGNVTRPIDTTNVNPNLDTDFDGLSDAEEQQGGTNPTAADTDRDGLSDFDEAKKYRSDPKKEKSGPLSMNDGEAVKKGLDPTTGKKLFEATAPTNSNQ